jgi:hypothetical protein
MKILFILSLLIFQGCSTKTSYKVYKYGGMRDALSMGNTQARISFEEINSKSNAYAVGAPSWFQYTYAWTRHIG